MEKTRLISIKELETLTKDDLKGKIIVFPTDTVYGVGCLYGDSVGVEKIYQMKKRDYGKPLPVLCDSIETVLSISMINENHMKYTKHWPGALTMILKSFNKDIFNGSVACRIPNSEIALSVLKKFGPLFTTSVNYSGEKELNSVDEILETFGNQIDFIVTDIPVLTKTPSTIINCLGDEMIIVRQGDIIFNI